MGPLRKACTGEGEDRIMRLQIMSEPHLGLYEGEELLAMLA
jgi:hypothetical protein